jgi:hypothetical protein
LQLKTAKSPLFTTLSPNFMAFIASPLQTERGACDVEGSLLNKVACNPADSRQPTDCTGSSPAADSRLQADWFHCCAAGNSDETMGILPVARTGAVADKIDVLAVGMNRFGDPGHSGIVEMRCIHVAVDIVHRIAHLAVLSPDGSFVEDT